MSIEDESMDRGDRPSAAELASRPSKAPRPAREPKKSAAALVLGLLFPGLGQIYNGQIAKALVVFFSFFGSLYAVIETDPLPFVFFMPFAYLFGVVDAYSSAERINAAAAGRSDGDEDPSESPAWGASLVGLGVLLLLNNLGWLRLADFHRFWPVVLIVAGALFVRGSLQRRKA